VGVEAGVLVEGIAVAQPQRRWTAEDFTKQSIYLIHQGVVVETWSIPFQQGKLGVMPAPPFSSAKYLADLVNRSRPRGQKTLHGKFRGGMQIETLPAPDTRFPMASREAGEVGVGGSSRGQHRRIDLQDVPAGKETTDLGEDLCALV
jgi:hypothetical protein